MVQQLRLHTCNAGGAGCIPGQGTKILRAARGSLIIIIIVITCVCVCVRVCVRTHACSVAQWCQTLCDPMDCSQPGSSVHGIFQARILEWVAMPSSRIIIILF